MRSMLLLLLSWLSMGFIGLTTLFKQLLCSVHQANPTPPSLDDIVPGVVVITGVRYRNIGFTTALALARHDRRRTVIITARTQNDANDAVIALLNEEPSGSFLGYGVNLASLHSVETFCETVTMKLQQQQQQQWRHHIDIFVLNAGVMFIPYTKSMDGYEMHFAVCVLGHFALVTRLRHLLAKASRIVVVSSEAHRCLTAYAYAKLSCVMLARELNARLTGTIAVSCHPGIVNTSLYRHLLPGLREIISIVGSCLFWNPEQSAQTILHAATASDIHGGSYYVNRREENASTLSQDPVLCCALWHACEAMIGIEW